MGEHNPGVPLLFFYYLLDQVLELTRKSILGPLIEPLYRPLFTQVFFLYSLPSGNTWSAYYHLPKALLLLNLSAITREKSVLFFADATI